jgi:hypothetical protein
MCKTELIQRQPNTSNAPYDGSLSDILTPGLVILVSVRLPHPCLDPATRLAMKGIEDVGGTLESLVRSASTWTFGTLGECMSPRTLNITTLMKADITVTFKYLDCE